MATALAGATKKKEQTDSMVKNMLFAVKKTEADASLAAQQALSYNRQNMTLEDKMSQLMRFKWAEEQRLAVLKTTNF
jgi:hypothetical protein